MTTVSFNKVNSFWYCEYRNTKTNFSGGSLSARKPESIYINHIHRDANLQLHKLSDDGVR